MAAYDEASRGHQPPRLYEIVQVLRASGVRIPASVVRAVCEARGLPVAVALTTHAGS